MSLARRAEWLLAPAAGLWLAGVLLPLVFVLRMSLYARGDVAGAKRYETLFYAPGTWSLESYVRVWTEAFYLEKLGFTLLLGLVVTGLTLTLGYVAAYGIYRSSTGGKVALITLLAAPKLTNILVYVFGLKLLLGGNGFWAVAAGETLFLLPYAALTIAAALEATPPGVEEAARGLGASPARAFWSVVFPLSAPGLWSAATLVLLWSLTAFLSPYLLGEPRHATVAVEVDQLMRRDLNWTLAAALNVSLMAILAGAAFGLTRLQARRA